MPTQLWSQDNFSKGELSPYMYARTQVEQYYNGLKQAQNVLTYPTGAAGKRFGSLYQATLSSSITSYNQIFFQTFQYVDQCIYQLVFRPLAIDIYLEGILIATVTTTLDAHSVYNLNYTVLDTAFRVAGEGFKPYDLTRSANAANIIVSSSLDQTQFGVTNALTPGKIYPVQFTTTNTLPTTTPQIKVGITYFIYVVDATHVEVFSTAYNAKFRLEKYALANIGVGVNSIVIQNTWTWAHPVFDDLPVYDFDGGYDAITFTPGAVSGNAVTITLSAGITPTLTNRFVGGAFFGNGGSGRITSVTDPTHFVVAVLTPFSSTGAILGSLAVLAEPAWSDARGWPQKCGSYQNRSLFANTDSLHNGFWASVVNDYSDFGDLTTDDDDAISWYPTSNNVNVIRFIVPFRSITVHTNSGIYSSPLSEISAITPSTFTLQLQDSTPADVLQPEAIDNQIIVLSGNDVHTMLWDGINNAYTSNIVSIVNEHLINDPVDEAAFADLARAGSRYVFIVNANGSMAIYQTLQAENVSGFTPAIMEQSYGTAQYRQAASSFDGRCWFVCERQQANGGSSLALTANTSDTLTAAGIQAASNATGVTAIAFTLGGGGVLPAPAPGHTAIATGEFYWTIPLSANTFKVYGSQEDALADENAFEFADFGTSAFVVAYPLVTIFTLEELSQDVKLDCAVYYNGAAASTVTTGALFNAQAVKMVGDGFGFEAVGFNNQVTFEAHGEAVQVEEAYIGFPINLIIEPMPLSAPPGPQNTLTKPKHIRTIRFMFNNTIGGTINDVPIALRPFEEVVIGDPPAPARGIFEMSFLKGWDDFNQPTFTIEHNEPFNIELLGIFYSVDF